jgi:hypothetical protein
MWSAVSSAGAKSVIAAPENQGRTFRLARATVLLPPFAWYRLRCCCRQCLGSCRPAPVQLQPLRCPDGAPARPALNGEALPSSGAFFCMPTHTLRCRVVLYCYPQSICYTQREQQFFAMALRTYTGAPSEIVFIKIWGAPQGLPLRHTTACGVRQTKTYLLRNHFTDSPDFERGRSEFRQTFNHEKCAQHFA